MDAIVVALIVALGTGLTQWLLAYQASRIRRQDKQDEWDRLDNVASHLVTENERVLRSTEATHAKLDDIHTLVNSSMTASMQNELLALRGQIVLMQRVATLNREAGGKSTTDEVAAIDAVQARVVELEALVRDRLAQQASTEAAPTA